MLQFFSIRPSSCFHSFKRCLPSSLQQQKHLLSTKTTAKTTFRPKGNNDDLSFGDAIPYIPIGTRGTKQTGTRRLWTKEEDQLLTKLYELHGPQYSLIASQIPNRLVSTVYARCMRLFNPQHSMKARPWEKKEIEALRKLVEKETGTSKPLEAETMINWVAIQQRLPYIRAVTDIKLTWYHTINPQWRRGRWTQEENERFLPLVRREGISDWRKISLLLGTRSPRQCLEKYRHNIDPSLRKGRFTPQEDVELLDAVKTHGDGNFLRIQRILKSPRTPRQLSKRYRYALDPSYDRSEWTEDEQCDLYRLTLELDRNMAKVKQQMNSKRPIAHMWNQFKIISEAKGATGKHSSGQHDKTAQKVNKETCRQNTKDPGQDDTNLKQRIRTTK